MYTNKNANSLNRKAKAKMGKMILNNNKVRRPKLMDFKTTLSYKNHESEAMVNKADV